MPASGEESGGGAQTVTPAQLTRADDDAKIYAGERPTRPDVLSSCRVTHGYFDTCRIYTNLGLSVVYSGYAYQVYTRTILEQAVSSTEYRYI